MDVLVCGGRQYNRKDWLYKALDQLHAVSPINRIIHGGANGADTLADNWAQENNVSVTVFPADWNSYGYTAGPRRNKEMLSIGRPNVVLAFPGGRGTQDMIMRSKVAADCDQLKLIIFKE